ncbi:MAG: DoxX family protein [Cyclobacteriaceae bacterium]|nr:DoxX family protein [Cyclobacteriaceae bacterium]
MIRAFLSARPWASDLALLVLRLSCGLMVVHGWGKFEGFAERSAGWPDPFHVTPPVSLGLTVFAELVCSVLVVLGLFTRLALVPLIVCMAVAVFVIHGADPFGEKEHALLFLLPYVALLLAGPGRYSLDSALLKR